MKKKVLIALSGGVDSATSAWLLQQSGFEVEGAILRLNENSGREIACAQSIADYLKIKLNVIQASDIFLREVIIPCAKYYQNGITPNPCCMCNPEVKFKLLYHEMQNCNADFLATGHYANIENYGTKFLIKRGKDKQKDQSYFLYRISSEILKYLMFPAGHYTKTEIRKISLNAGIPCAERPDSQDTCFAVPGEICGDTLFRLANLKPKIGFFRYNGKIVGPHNGLQRYTIGQRSGLGVALGVPGYIKNFDIEKNEIMLTTNYSDLEQTSFLISNAVWYDEVQQDEFVDVQVRYRSKAVKCTIEQSDADTWKVILISSVHAVTPGQSAVFYRGDVVVGGGIILK